MAISRFPRRSAIRANGINALRRRQSFPRAAMNRYSFFSKRSGGAPPAPSDRATPAGYERFAQRREPDEIGNSYGLATCQQFRHSVEALVRFSAPECM